MVLCACNCGGETKIDKRSGKPSKWVKGHSNLSEESRKRLSEARKGRKLSDETKLKLSEINNKRRTGRATICSPYIPNLVIRFSSRHHRWVCRDSITNKQTTHARTVYIRLVGPIPENYHIHHISGRCTEIEDDRPENLLAIPRHWNSTILPRLAKKFGIHESEVTKIYIELKDSIPLDELREAIRKRLTFNAEN